MSDLCWDCQKNSTAIIRSQSQSQQAQSQVLIDESLDVGKGANTVVSLLHHYLEHHSHGASRVHLNADNCCGQNKNNTFLQV
jgi:hypothetical protein